MATIIDLDWYAEISGSPDTLDFVRRAAEDQRRLREGKPANAVKGLRRLELDGLTLVVDGIFATAALEVFQEIFANNNHFLSRGFIPRESSAVLDLGSNLGFYALALRKRAPGCSVLCVEANHDIFPLLEENLRLNDCADIRCLNRAVANSDGMIEFTTVPEAPSIGGIRENVISRPWMTPDRMRQKQVRGVTLGELDRLFGRPRIDIMKIDIEGSELELLSGGSEVFGKTDNIVVERHRLEDRDRLISVMRGLGFAFVLEEDPEKLSYYADMYFSRAA